MQQDAWNASLTHQVLNQTLNDPQRFGGLYKDLTDQMMNDMK